jgi:uncharacterized protein (DUF2141 family)
MVKYLLSVLFVCLVVASGNVLASDSVTVSVRVDGLRNNNGICRLLLFASKKGFPDSPKDALLVSNENICGQEVVFSIKIKPGMYAISVLHDENINGVIDKAWYGKPKEGFGTSNNPKVGFSAPGYEESEIRLDEKNRSLVIKLNYL